MTSLSQQLDRWAGALLARCPRLAEAPFLTIVAGSGLGDVVDAVDDVEAVPYHELEGFPSPTVHGHAGRLVVGRLEGLPVALLQGRVHLYEGHSATDVVRPLRIMCRAGTRSVLLTNAAGGIHLNYGAGDLMVLRDHLNMTGANPLLGSNDDALGERFPDLSRAWDRAMGDSLMRAGATCGARVHEGVYAGLLGPNYETPAEVRMLRALGADAVGMSTVLEAIAVRHMGVQLGGLSVISNAAAGTLGPDQEITHAEVKDVAAAVGPPVERLLRAFVADRASWWENA